jgi:hypothetical protein
VDSIFWAGLEEDIRAGGSVDPRRAAWDRGEEGGAGRSCRGGIRWRGSWGRTSRGAFPPKASRGASRRTCMCPGWQAAGQRY